MKKLPVEIMYEEYNDGATTIELSEKYNCSVPTIRAQLIKYCDQTGKNFVKRSRGPFKRNIPTEKIYIEYINGESSTKLAEKYGCSKGRILAEIKRYAKTYNLELHIKSNDTRPIELPIEKIYIEYINGKTQLMLAEEYDCSTVTISRKLTKYCNENNIDIVKSKKEMEIKKYKKMYEEHKSGLTPIELSEKYNCSKKEIISKLHDYANITGEELIFPRKSYDKKDISDEEIYIKYKSGIPSTVIARENNCTSRTILLRLRRYSKANGQDLIINSRADKIEEERLREMYELSRSGVTQSELMKKYNYSQTKLSNALKNQYKLAFLRELKQILAQEEKQQQKVKKIGDK